MSFQQSHSRRIVPPGASRKRKERQANASSNGFKQPAPKAPTPSQTTAPTLSSNRLLAGYMAYEYLTKGTLFGQKFDPARAEAVPLMSSSAEPRRGKPVEAGKVGAGSGSGVGAAQERYAEVASMLKTDGAHIPGIVNPTQLAKWIQM
ncbi:PREDICTED: embryo sac development arrest [Prunus dulcis]|uniref:PREDICTED: embryo sac development arrest n=1 Tax=Prunus dulcis TaxID=3755 RepID=A0A5E4EKH2_PRUDU|nr:uncharacterized protein LOC117616798 [Prunus dulcis]KAI5348133.1 hypothetical protein L3X38_001020 [Prunus dulcis]VVA16144.1 PREDICTED: embryo sac development arrest [Prunus dulcis]